MEHVQQPLRHRTVDGQGDGAGVLAPALEGDHFGLGKDRAHTVDLQWLPPLSPPGQGRLAKLIQGKTQGEGHDLQKTAGTGGAFVVHLKIEDPAVGGQTDHLGILAADIKNQAAVGEKTAGAQGMGLDFGDRLSGEVLPGQIAAITGGDNLTLRPRPQLGQEAPCLGARIKAALLDSEIGQLTIAPDRHLDGSGTEIDPDPPGLAAASPELCLALCPWHLPAAPREPTVNG